MHIHTNTGAFTDFYFCVRGLISALCTTVGVMVVSAKNGNKEKQDT